MTTSNDPKSSRRAGHLPTVVLLILSLVTAGFTRHFAINFQHSHSPLARRDAGSGTSLAGMDSYALALLLGGLRGPLVMVLWANSEAQKADRDLEGIDTQIEWIRRLQPEFDSVHVFQMWNKAYNLSVQMVGLSNKYTTILDAIDYGRSVDAERPDNLNILKELARIYGDKLATSNPEKYYYRARLKRETKYREQTGAQRGQATFQRLAHDPLLTPDGHVLPQYLEPRFPVDPAKGPDAYNGADLQFLKRYEPYTYGVSPFALGFNYHKRGQVLMISDKQKPLGLSTSVIDSQPALALKTWAEAEWEDSRKLECKAFNVKLPPNDRFAQEAPTAALPLTAPVADPAALAELLFTYDLCIRLATDSIAEYERHLHDPDFITNRGKYAPHMEAVIAMQSLLAGDLNYLQAMQVSGDQRAKLLLSASQNYRNSIREHGLLTLRYYSSDQLAAAVMPPGVTRATIGTGGPGSKSAVTTEDVMRMMDAATAELSKPGTPVIDENPEDRAEYMAYINRATERLNQIKQASGN